MKKFANEFRRELSSQLIHVALEMLTEVADTTAFYNSELITKLKNATDKWESFFNNDTILQSQQSAELRMALINAYQTLGEEERKKIRISQILMNSKFVKVEESSRDKAPLKWAGMQVDLVPFQFNSDRLAAENQSSAGS